LLSRDVRLEGFTGTDWVRLAEVVRPPDPRPREVGDPDEPSPEPVQPADGQPNGGIIAVTTGTRLRKLLSTRAGRLDPLAEAWPAPLHDLAARHAARWALELHTGALDDLMDRFAARLRREQDLLAQALELLAVVRELESEGLIRSWPRRLENWPLPSERMVLRAFDAFCPEGRAVLLGVFQRGEVATCIALRRARSGFDWVVGPDELRGEMGLTAGDWTRDYRHLARAVERRVAPLALGCFGEMSTFRRLAADHSPGAWAGAVASRDIILSPVVPAIAVPLGIDAGRAAFYAVRGLAERLGASSWLEQAGALYPAFERVKELALGDRSWPGENGFESLLGFDPFSALRRLLSRDHHDEHGHDAAFHDHDQGGDGGK
jgi:hypothetical protein